MYGYGYRSRGISILAVAYLVIGAFVAASHHYLAHVHGISGVLSAVIAIVLWPLVLLGVNLHIGIG
jgi:hypothetical protein